jgi:hypothetical protein
MVACAETHKDVAVVGARLTYRDGTVQHAGIAFCQRDGLPRHIYRGFSGNHPAVTRHREFQAVTGACLLVRHDAFATVQGFDEAFENGFEDIDLCLRLRASGFRTWYCGTTDITHLESVSLQSQGHQEKVPNAANQDLFLTRWHSQIRRDEVAIYAEDGLLSVDSDDIYPVRITLAPELGTAITRDVDSGLAKLLEIRSRQVFDLEKEIGHLTCQLLDNGIEP